MICTTIDLENNMYVIMGGTGHVGSATVEALLAFGEEVTIVTRDASRASQWLRKGAKIAVADVNEVDSLRAAFRKGRRAFLLNPPADVTTDTDGVERVTVSNILAAIDGSGLEKVVAQSTGGARPGERIGDLSVLWELEEGLRNQSIPAAINRAGYYMSNWDSGLETVRDTSELPTTHPANLMIPMIAPRDLGEFAAQRLRSHVDDIGIRYAEGPERYTSIDVAQAFSQALGRPIRVAITPREKWVEAFRGFGFSTTAAESYARMLGVTVDEGFDMPPEAWRGRTTLQTYIQNLVQSY